MSARCLLLASALSLVATPAWAQRVPFARSFDVGSSPTLDVTTVRGKIAVKAGAPGRIVVNGLVTVRVGVDVPTDALQIAQRIAAAPPLRHAGDAVTLEAPADGRDRRAVTVSYEVEVPPATRVTTTSESGETRISGIEGTLYVKTQSAMIAVEQVRGNTTIVTGSGAVGLDDVGGTVDVKTASSAITADKVGGRLRVDTGSGAVVIGLTGDGPVHVRTSSSGVRLRDLAGAADVETGSGRIDVSLALDASLKLDASTGSGSIVLKGVQVDGTVEKRRVAGNVSNGASEVKLVSRSGSIRITR